MKSVNKVHNKNKADDWIVTDIASFAPFIYGKGLPEGKRINNGHFPVYGSNGVIGFHDKPLVKSPTVIVGRKGTIGSVHFCEGGCWPIDTTFYYTNEDVDNVKYVYYLLKSVDFNGMNSDSAIPGLNRDNAHAIPIRIPSNAKERRYIVDILGTLDDKIENNHKVAKTLEAITQAIFKSWFIDFEFPDENGQPYKSSGGELVDSELGVIPKGWVVGTLGDILVNTKIPLRPGNQLGDRKYVPIDCLSMDSICIGSYEPNELATSSLIAFEKDDILLGAMRVYFHRVNLAPFSGVTRATTFVLRVKYPNILSFAILLMNLDSTINYANSHSKGTTMPYAVWGGSLENMPIIIPDRFILKNFHDIVYPFLSKIRDSIFFSASLSAIRDNLLPKLISGKIRVPVEDANE